jgi:hypothetical protein
VVILLVWLFALGVIALYLIDLTRACLGGLACPF